MSTHQITSKQQLVDLIGEPLDFIKGKVASALDQDMRDYIARASLLFLSTIDADGNPDISPKGDPAGFVQVENDSLIHIPDRPGNKLVFGFTNILENPAVGLIFVVPNERETLRIKGKAVLSNDPALLAGMSVGGKPALLATTVAIEECFFHCGKAMIRSKTWEPDSWAPRPRSVIARQFARKMEGDQSVQDSIEEALETNYKDELY